MPETPAQELLTMTKSSSTAQTERMATAEELYALKRIAELESAIAALATAETSEAEKVKTDGRPVAAKVLCEGEQTEQTRTDRTAVDTMDGEGGFGKEALAEIEMPIAETLNGKIANVASFEEMNESSARAHAEEVTESAAPHSGGMQGSWMLEFASILDQHRIWVETGGEAGTKADLCGANLENADLTGVNLQGAFLQRANLRGAGAGIKAFGLG